MPKRFVLAWFVLALGFLFPHHVKAQTPPTDNPVTQPSLAPDDPGDELVPNANEIRDRIAAEQGWRPADLGEEFKLHAIEQLQLQTQLYGNQLAGATPPAGMPQWRSLGPTRALYERNGVVYKQSDSGRIRTILPHPTNPDVMYVLTSGGGLWKTTNFTKTRPVWKALTDALISTSGGSVAFGRTPDTLYLGIGDPFDVLGLIAGVMVKSTDGGKTWSPFVNLAGASSTADVKVDTNGPNDVVLVSTDIGLFRSSDNGATYAPVATFAGKKVWSLARTSAGWLVNVIGAIYVSTDRGATWSPIPNAGNVISGIGRATIATAAPGESTVYAIAGTPDGSAQRDLFKSTDGGLNWTALNLAAKAPSNPDCWQTDMNILGGQAWYNQLLLVDPADPSRNTVYLGGQLATAGTTDGGNTWKLLSTWLPGYCSTLPYVHADAHAAATMTVGGNELLLFGTDGGLFASSDGGNSWSDDKNEGIVSLLMNTIASTPYYPQSVLSGLQDCGTRSRLGATTTYNQVVGGDGEGAGWSQANGAVALASVPYSGIYRSVNLVPGMPNGWLRGNKGIRGLDYYSFWTPIDSPSAAADPSGLQFFHYTGWKVYKTSDGGQSWQVIAQRGVNGIRITNAPIFRNTIYGHAVAISQTDVNRIAVAEFSGFIAITTDGGAHWSEQQLIGAVPGYGGFNKSPAWANDSVLYLSAENPFSGALRMLKSTDGGNHWSAAANGLPDLPMRKIVPDTTDTSGNTVYAATWIGVYRTTDGGAHWSLFGAGLPRVDVSDLYIAPDGSFLRASTYGRGAWEISLK